MNKGIKEGPNWSAIQPQGDTGGFRRGGVHEALATSAAQATRYGWKGWFEENRPLRKPLAAVLIVVWLVLVVLTTAVAGASRNGVMSGSV